MKKRIVLGFGLFCLLGLSALTLWAASGRESKYLPPQEVEIMYATEDHAYQVKDINDAVRWKVLPDGTMAIYNTSGATVYAITGSAGKPILGTKASYVSGVSMRGASTGNTSYSMTTAHDLYIFTVSGGSYPAFLPAQISGVSVYMPTGSAALDGFKLHVAAHPMSTYYSGTSDICFVPANDSVQSKGVTDFIVSLSGITVSTASADVFAHDLIDNEAETVTFIYEWATSGGTWWQVDIQ